MALVFKRLIKDSGKTLIVTDTLPEANIFTYEEGNLYLMYDKIYYVGKSQDGVYSIQELPNQETLEKINSELGSLKLKIAILSAGSKLPDDLGHVHPHDNNDETLPQPSESADASEIKPQVRQVKSKSK